MASVGRLRDRITILTKTQVADEIGGFENVFTEGETIWARITPVAGTRALELGQIVNGKPYNVEIRYRENVTEDTLFKWNATGSMFTVKSIVDVDARNKRIQLICIEHKQWELQSS